MAKGDSVGEFEFLVLLAVLRLADDAYGMRVRREIAAGITLHEALKAYDQLQQEGINVRILDAYSVKPLDEETIIAAAEETGGRLVVVEDHWPEGGLGDAVLDVFAQYDGPLPRVVKLAVQSMPGSGTPDELLEEAGINAHHIVQAVKVLAHKE